MAARFDIWCEPSVMCGHFHMMNLADFLVRRDVTIKPADLIPAGSEVL